MLDEAHVTAPRRGIVLRVLLNRMRHDGCGGRPSGAELLTGIDGVSSRPVRRIVLVPLVIDSDRFLRIDEPWVEGGSIRCLRDRLRSRDMSSH